MKKKLKLYSSQLNELIEVSPIVENKLKIYACGPTVYSFPHIGNFRSFLTADLLVRTAKALGYQVEYVCNITDVGHLTEDDLADAVGEDKMVKALKKSAGKFSSIWDLARFYTHALVEDWKRLNLIEPDLRPRASEHVTEQIEMITKLVEKDIAYETDKGVYFNVAKFPKYGQLSGNLLDKLLNEVRDVVTDLEKRNPQDFALWKKDTKHLMRWYSPFGWGYPGWHIECSAMAMKYLGDSIDIHTGGVDNKFPHHECEIAQSETCTGKTFVNYWLHTAHLIVNGKRMSKRDGTFFTVQDIFNKNVHPLALRHALTCAIYREPLNFSINSLKASIKFYNKLKELYNKLSQLSGHDNNDLLQAPEEIQQNYHNILSAMAAGLNTPIAYSEMLTGIKLINHNFEKFTSKQLNGCMAWLKRCDDLLGILGINEANNNNSNQEIDLLLEQRNIARKNGDYDKADQIRQTLLEQGIAIKDNTESSEWYYLI